MPYVPTTDFIHPVLKCGEPQAETMRKVTEMFASQRHILRRTAAPTETPSAPDAARPVADLSTAHRHPAMRGLNVSPVHGRHCICGRCSPEPPARAA